MKEIKYKDIRFNFELIGYTKNNKARSLIKVQNLPFKNIGKFIKYLLKYET